MQYLEGMPSWLALKFQLVILQKVEIIDFIVLKVAEKDAINLTKQIVNFSLKQTLRKLKKGYFLLSANIQPSKIRKFLYNQGLINNSTLQIRLLDKDTSDQNINSETDDLIEYIESETVGYYEVFEKEFNHINHRLAFLR